MWAVRGNGPPRTVAALTLLASCLLGIVGCSDTATGPEMGDGEAIQTDRASYELVRRTLTIVGREYPYLEAEIRYTFTNQTGQPVKQAERI